VRQVKWLLLLGLGLGGLAAAGPQGCAATCPDLLDEEFTECSSRPGLRYTKCSDSYEFNDGVHFDNLGLTLDYCYCGDGRVSCDDGRTASMCNTTLLDGTASLVYDDGAVDNLQDGVEACLGYPSCTLVTNTCSFGGWYLQCTGAGTAYVVSTGEVKSTLSAAVIACNPGSEDGTPKPGSCNDAIDSCLELADCGASVACDGGFGGECNSTVRCYTHSDLASCASDLACKWEVY
jgi:hypothetical protein